MRYMVIETYVAGPAPVYARARDRGRMLPDGLVYLDSWVDARRLDRCFQLMETDDPALLDEWIGNWRDIVEFEVVPVIDSDAAAARGAPDLSGGLAVDAPRTPSPTGKRAGGS